MIWGRSEERAREAAAVIGGGAAAVERATVARRCDLVVIAVADDAVAPLAAELAAEIAGAPFLCHVSGRSGAGILAPLAEAGAVTAAIHPAMTFTGDAEREAARLAGAYFAITGSSASALDRAHALVGLLGGHAADIPETQRPLYHAALCHAANHLVTLLDSAFGMLASAGVNDPRALVAPLVRAATDNGLTEGFAALSGPLLRGDSATIAQHLTAIRRDCPEQLPAYRAMARATIAAIERSGIDGGAARLIEVLEQE